MNCNVGKIDKIIRIIVGLLIIGAGVLTGNWLGAIGLILIGTAIFSFCPLYSLLGMNTGCKPKEK